MHQSAQSAAGRDGALERPGAAQGRNKEREWCRRRPLVVPLLVELVGCSPASRARLWASEGMGILLELLQVRSLGMVALQVLRREKVARVREGLKQCRGGCSAGKDNQGCIFAVLGWVHEVQEW